MSGGKNRLLFTCFYAFFYCGIVMLSIGSSLPDLSSAYGLDYSMRGALLSCYSLGNLASGIICGLSCVYFGQRVAAVILTLSVCAGMSLLTLSGLPFLLFTACMLIGLGRGSLITFSQASVSLLTGGRPRTTAMLHAAFAGGAILAPLMFSALRVIDWRCGLWVAGVLGCVCAGLFAGVRDYPERAASSGKSLAFLRDKGFMLTGALMFLYLCCEFAVNGWLVTYMTHKDMTMNYSQAMAALLWVVILAGRLFCAWVSRYVEQKKLLFMSSFGACAAFGGMLLSEGRVPVAVSVACLGLCMSGISPILYASSAPFSNKYPMAMGVLFTIGCTGGTLMPLITGIIAERSGFDGGMSMILGAFVLLVIFSAVNPKK